MSSNAVRGESKRDPKETGCDHAFGEMSREQFKLATVWYAQDIALGRPPLSRWHQPHRQEYLDLVSELEPAPVSKL